MAVPPIAVAVVKKKAKGKKKGGERKELGTVALTSRTRPLMKEGQAGRPSFGTAQGRRAKKGEGKREGDPECDKRTIVARIPTRATRIN